jgi:hypothetical protein
MDFVQGQDKRGCPSGKAQDLAAILASRHASPTARMTLDRHSAPAMSFKEAQSGSQDTDMKQVLDSIGCRLAPQRWPFTLNGSVTLPRNHGNGVTLRDKRGWLSRKSPRLASLPPSRPEGTRARPAQLVDDMPGKSRPHDS